MTGGKSPVNIFGTAAPTQLSGPQTGGMSPMEGGNQTSGLHPYTPHMPTFTPPTETGGLHPGMNPGRMPTLGRPGQATTNGPAMGGGQTSAPGNPGVDLTTQNTWEGGPRMTQTRANGGGLPGLVSGLNTNGMPELAGGLDTSGFTNFDQDFAGASSSAARNAYQGMTQFMDEDFGKDTESLRNQLVNQGLQPGSEAFDREMSLMQRGQNASRQQAAAQSQQIGHQQAGDLLARALETRRLQGSEAGQDAATRLASRGMFGQEQGQNAAMGLASRNTLMGERERDADRTWGQSLGVGQLALGARGQDLGLAQAQANASGQAASAGAAAQSAREARQLESELALRRMGLDQDSMDFNQYMQLVGAARGGVNMPNFGGATPLDVGGAYGIASGNQNSALNRQASDRGALAGLGAAALGGLGNYLGRQTSIPGNNGY